MTKHFKEESGSCVLGDNISFSSLLEKEVKPKYFVCTTQVKNLVLADIGLEGFKNEVRAGGFDVIYVMNDIGGPALEEIWV